MMETSISFNYLTAFELANASLMEEWIIATAKNEGYSIGELNYIFCDDPYILDINKAYLNHDYFTDIITFDYVEDKIIHGDIYISIDTVKSNADTFNTTFENELSRVIIHGLLHLCTYKDKTEEEQKIMSAKEDYYLSLQNKV